MILNLAGRPVTDFSDPTIKVKWSKKDIYGDWVYGSLRTIAHLEQTSQRALEKFGHEVEVLQGSYNKTVEASAGTHDGDAVIDFFIPMTDWWVMQRFFREQGWACWYRYPPSFGRHCHAISLGFSIRVFVGYLVAGQVLDYRNNRSGLSGHIADTSWHPANIDATVFDFDAWERELEDDMPYTDWSKTDKAALLNDLKGPIAKEVVKELMRTLVATDPELNVRAALRQAQNGPATTRQQTRALAKALDVTLPEEK